VGTSTIPGEAASKSDRQSRWPLVYCSEFRRKVKMELLASLYRLPTLCRCREKRMRLLFGFSWMILSAVSLSAAAITYETGGTFNSSTAASAYSGPDETWSLSFVVDTNPAVSEVNPDGYFDADFSDFSYTLNGAPVAIQPVDIRFFSAVQYGGLDICFTVACQYFNSPTDGIEIETSQLYTGSESAPTMLSGIFSWSDMSVFIDSAYYPQVPPGTGSLLATEVATPEPSTLPTLACGAFLILAGRRLRGSA
jgi:hypothetical protein